MKSYVLIVAAMLIPSALGLAEEISLDPSADSFMLGESIQMDGVNGNWYTDNNGAKSSAGLYFSLTNHDLQGANWYFNVREDDPSQWTASFSAYGLMLEEEEELVAGVPRDQKSNITRNGVSLGYDIEVSPAYNWERDGNDWIKTEDWFFLSANLHLEPSVIISSNFSYREFNDAWVQPAKNRWSISYYIQGEFIADTPVQAQALGAQFVTAVPEPSTISLVISSLIGAIGFLYRRKW